MKILIVSTTRADFGILENLIKSLRKNKFFKVKFLASGSHFIKDQGLSINEISESKIKIDKKIEIKINTHNYLKLADFSTKLGLSYARYLQEIKPDLVIVLGDRFEILTVTFFTYLMRIPIAHIHGGEITEGSMDDSIRHSITKLANIHFVTNKDHRKRVIQLGEHPKNVFNVGSLGQEKLSNLHPLKRNELEKKHKIKFSRNNFLVTYHPETINPKQTKKNFNELLLAIKKFHNANFFFTAPGIDIYSNQIKKKIKEFKKNKKNIFYIKNFGSKSYHSLLHYVNGIIGNSSSGILEMPLLKNFTINIGNRQKGRGKSKYILNTKPESKKIENLINKILDIKKNNKEIKVRKSNTIKKIISILKIIDYKSVMNKKFYDL